MPLRLCPELVIMALGAAGGAAGDMPGRAGTSADAARTLNCVTSPALQQPQWPDRDRLEAVARRLEGLPPLVLAAECDQLKERLASVARGEAFLLQGGDCAETFAGTTADSSGASSRPCCRWPSC